MKRIKRTLAEDDLEDEPMEPCPAAAKNNPEASASSDSKIPSVSEQTRKVGAERGERAEEDAALQMTDNENAVFNPPDSKTPAEVRIDDNNAELHQNLLT